MRWCFDRRVLIGLAVVAAGVLLVQPRWFAAALPVLLLAICPLSMLLMMRGMGHGDGKAESAATSESTGERHQSLGDGERRDAEVAQLRDEVNILRAELHLRNQHDQQADEQR